MVKAKLGLCSLFSNFIHYSLFLRGTHPPTSITVAAGGQFVTFCSQSLREKNFSLISISVKKKTVCNLQTVFLSSKLLYQFDIFVKFRFSINFILLVFSRYPALQVQR